MRDFHDGVGGHFIAMLGLAQQKAVSPQQIAQMAQEALIDFRIAIDSLTPNELDLQSAIANLRFRLQVRFDAVDVVAVWEIEDFPSTINFTVEEIFNIQRIVLEATTNCIKHAKQLTQIVISLTWNQASSELSLAVCDNGSWQELREETIGVFTQGRGFANIKTRARALGARLEIVPATTTNGTLVLLVFQRIGH